MGGAPKDMETLDYTKDKDPGETPLSQQAVYLPDPKVNVSYYEKRYKCKTFSFSLSLSVPCKGKFEIWILSPNQKKKKR